MLRVVTAASNEPVSLEEAKAHLKVEHNEEDALVQAFVTAARETVERQTGYALAEASYEWTPVGDRTEPLPIWPGTVTSAVGEYPILFTATPSEPPAALKAAILLLAADLYANREASIAGARADNPAVEALTFPYRRVLP